MLDLDGKGYLRHGIPLRNHVSGRFGRQIEIGVLKDISEDLG
jgi:hypothetical protein